jgi:hypothetical protein
MTQEQKVIFKLVSKEKKELCAISRAKWREHKKYFEHFRFGRNFAYATWVVRFGGKPSLSDRYPYYEPYQWRP